MTGGIIMAGVPGNAWRAPTRRDYGDASGQHPLVRGVDTAKQFLDAFYDLMELYPGTAAEESEKKPETPPYRPRSSFESESQFLVYQALRRNSMPENKGIRRAEDMIPTDTTPPPGHPAGTPAGHVTTPMEASVRLSPWDDAKSIIRAVPFGSAADEEARLPLTDPTATPPPPGHPAGPPIPSESPPQGHPAGPPKPADSPTPIHTSGPGREMAP